jgi:photosystem II stability/assembly factor-like uncharacterized protein
LNTKKGRQKESLRRQTGGMRMVLWAILLIAPVALIAYLLLSSGRGGTDRGESSRFASIHTFDTADYHSLAFYPTSDLFFFGHHNGLQKSGDGGKTWETAVDEEGWDAMNTAFDPFASETIYVAGHDVFVRSDDGGGTWEEVRPNLPSLDRHTFAPSASKEGRLYAVPAGEGLYVSEDGGQQWQLVSTDVPPGSNSIVDVPDGTLLLGATDQGILRSEDGGATWTQSRTGIDIGAVFVVKGDPKGERLYAGTDHGVYVSADGGRTWSTTALDDTWVIVVGVSPSDPNIVLAINRNGDLYRSTDRGATWG